MINTKMKLIAVTLGSILGTAALAAPDMTGIPFNVHVYSGGHTTDYAAYSAINLGYGSNIVNVLGSSACTPGSGCTWSGVTLSAGSPTFDVPNLKLVGSGSAPVNGTFTVSYSAKVGSNETVTPATPYTVTVTNSVITATGYQYAYSSDNKAMCEFDVLAATGSQSATIEIDCMD